MIAWNPLADWLRGLPEEEMARALTAIGVDFADIGRSRAMSGFGRAAPVISWSLSEDEFAHRSRRTALELAELMPRGLDLRLAVEAAAVPDELVPTLLCADDVASVMVAVGRPIGALVPRPWQWPLRVGLVGLPHEAVDELRQQLYGPMARLLDVHRVEEEPGAMDVAIVAGSLTEAVTRVTQLRTVANALVLLEEGLERPAIVEAQLALARAATGATSSALTTVTDLPDLLVQLTTNLARAQPFDVALTAATKRKVRLWGEPLAIERAAVPEIALRWTRELQVQCEDVPEVARVSEALSNAAEGVFAGESHEALRIAELREELEPTYEELVEERWFQARVGEHNVVAHGDNRVHVFIGPLEADAAGVPFDESSLPQDEARSYRLTALFLGAHPDADVQEADLDLPRFGRSGDVTFTAYVPQGAGARLCGRIVILFRNRILQTAVLSGTVGEHPRLSEMVGLVPRLAGLDDRRGFDVALLMNDTGGEKSITRFSNGKTRRITGAGGVPDIDESIANLLATAADQARIPKKGIQDPEPLRLLIKLAVNGRDLFKELEDQLGDLRDVESIQLVSARRTWRLPIEVVYMRYAPDDDAQLCDNYVTDPALCTGRCTPEEDTSRVCPNAFWGLSKIIERYAYDPEEEDGFDEGHKILGQGQPRRNDRALRIDNVLFAASERVRPADRKTTLAALGAGAARASDWNDWCWQLKQRETHLLVLLPHADTVARTLEISEQTLAQGRIEPPYINGGHKLEPVVVLFGCRTAGNPTNPTVFAQRFMGQGASVVFHSSTDLLGRHAAVLAQRLTTYLKGNGRNTQLLADALRTFRAEAVRDGYVMALAISAYGDADWQV